MVCIWRRNAILDNYDWESAGYFPVETTRGGGTDNYNHHATAEGLVIVVVIYYTGPN